MIPALLVSTTLDGLLKEHPSLPGILLAILCLVILVFVILPRFPSWWRGRGRPVVDPVQVTQMIAGAGALVVDLRSVEAFRTGHIRGSLHVPFGDLLRRFAIPDPKAQRSLILVDETDELSHLAFDQLSTRGFSWIYVLKGGLKAWRRANFPIAK
jgi:rhodanese-related sulfurtransferase